MSCLHTALQALMASSRLDEHKTNTSEGTWTRVLCLLHKLAYDSGQSSIICLLGACVACCTEEGLAQSRPRGTCRDLVFSHWSCVNLCLQHCRMPGPPLSLSLPVKAAVSLSRAFKAPSLSSSRLTALSPS